MFTCHFEAPRCQTAMAPPVQDGWLVRRRASRSAFVSTTSGGRGDGLRVFAGLRSDPFFIDLPALFESQKTERLAFKDPGDNSLDGANVLSLVVEVDTKRLPSNGRPPLFGAVGETVVTGKLPIRIERFGRMEVKNVTMAMKHLDPVNRDLEIRDLYNLEDAFHLSKEYGGAYRARLNANLAFYGPLRRQDRLAARAGWRPPLDRAAARRLPGGRRVAALRRRQLLRDRAGDARGTPLRDVRRPLTERRRDGHVLHADDQRRQGTAHPRRRRPADDAGRACFPTWRRPSRRSPRAIAC